MAASLRLLHLRVGEIGCRPGRRSARLLHDPPVDTAALQSGRMLRISFGQQLLECSCSAPS